MSESNSVLTIEDFKNWKSQNMTVHLTEEHKEIVRILDVEACGEKKNKSRIPFSLILLTEMKDQYYTQGSFIVVLPDGQEEPMFMVPIGVDMESGGMKYEVIYN